MIFPLKMCGQCTYVTDEVTGVLQLKRLLLFLIRFSLSLPGVLPVLPPLFSFLFLLCFFIFPFLLLLLLLLFDLPFVCYRAGEGKSFRHALNSERLNGGTWMSSWYGGMIELRVPIYQMLDIPAECVNERMHSSLPLSQLCEEWRLMKRVSEWMSRRAG